MQQYGGAGIAAGRVGIGANFAKSRLMLAKRAGYLPQHFQMQPNQAPEQWKVASSNLARDARAAGFSNPMQFLRQGATQGGQLPRATRMRPGAQADPSQSLAYANSRIAALQGPQNRQIPRLPNLPRPGQRELMGILPQLQDLLRGRLVPYGRS